MCNLPHFIVEKFMLSKNANSKQYELMFPYKKLVFWKEKKATDFIISIIITGNFGALEQRHGKFLPRCNIDTVSDYRTFKIEPSGGKVFDWRSVW